MRCNVCGRELKPGQMFCQCGNTVGNASGASLNVNAPSSNKLILIGAIVGLVLLAAIGTIVAVIFGSAGSAVKDRTKWERISGSGFQMTVPSGMREGEVFVESEGFTKLKALRSGQIAIEVSSVSYSSVGITKINRKKLEELIRANLKSLDVNGQNAEPKEHGTMVYYDYTTESSGIFFGTKDVHIVDGMFVGKNALYEVCVACPESKYAEYEESIFAWYDSFKGE